MRVYFPFILSEIKKNLAYKSRWWFRLLSRMLGVVTSYFLWMAIYENSTNEIMCGFTKEDMKLYVILNYVIVNTVFISMFFEIGRSVIDGSIANNLIKPIDYRKSIIAQAMGRMLSQLIMPTALIIVVIEIYIYYSQIKQHSIINLVMFFLSMFLSFYIYVLFDYCFSMIAFFTTYLFGINTMKNVVISFFSGQLIPINFFPESISKVISLMPFSSMSYTPIMIYLNKYSANQIVKEILKQFIWVIILYILGSIIWKSIEKRLEILGG